jgi:hypothetical protein
MGMAMCDEEEGKWRVVVDLEWSESKIPGIPYGNKKGGFLVCELIPGHHDSEIAATEDKTDICEAYIANEAIYVGIIAAGNAQTHPVIKKTPAGNFGDSGGELRHKEKHAHPRP